MQKYSILYLTMLTDTNKLKWLENEKTMDSGIKCSFEGMHQLAAEVNTSKPWVWETGKRIKINAFLVRIRTMGVNNIFKIAPSFCLQCAWVLRGESISTEVHPYCHCPLISRISLCKFTSILMTFRKLLKTWLFSRGLGCQPSQVNQTGNTTRLAKSTLL